MKSQILQMLFYTVGLHTSLWGFWSSFTSHFFNLSLSKFKIHLQIIQKSSVINQLHSIIRVAKNSELKGAHFRLFPQKVPIFVKNVRLYVVK